MNFRYRLPVEFELYEQAGDIIKSAMKASKMTVEDISKRLKDEGVFQSYSTARRFVIDIRNGYYGLLIKHDFKRNDARTRINLERLASLFSIIGIDADDSVINIFRGFNSDFVCPLKRDEYLNI